MTKAYQQPLQANEIRILLLQPCPDVSRPIVCALTVLNLESIPFGQQHQYEALSYTWGAPYKQYSSPDRSILLSGEEKPVTGNLYDALERLRHPHDVRELWIDALCIDQENDKERSEQVAKMALIYSHASSVSVWLGKESHLRDAETVILLYHAAIQHESAFEELRRSLRKSDLLTRIPADAVPMEELALLRGKVEQLCMKCFETNVIPVLADTLQGRRAPHEWLEMTTFSGQIHNPLIAIMFGSLAGFYDRTYWLRRWVLQEVWQAVRINVYCGNQEIEWQEFKRAHRLVTEMLYECGPHTQWQPKLSPPPLKLTVANKARGLTPMSRLYQRMGMHERSECREPVDRMYSLLGFEATYDFRPDYAMAPAQAWIRLSRDIPPEGYGPYLLWYAANQLHGRDPSLPSWVPDYSKSNAFGLTRAADYKPEQLHLYGDLTATVDVQNRLTCRLRCFGEVGHIGGQVVLMPLMSRRALILQAAGAGSDHETHQNATVEDDAAPLFDPLPLTITTRVKGGDVVCAAGERTLALRPKASGTFVATGRVTPAFEPVDPSKPLAVNLEEKLGRSSHVRQFTIE